MCDSHILKTNETDMINFEILFVSQHVSRISEIPFLKGEEYRGQSLFIDSIHKHLVSIYYQQSFVGDTNMDVSH